MEPIGGMTPTGRRVPGTSTELVELVDPQGLRHTAVLFSPRWVGAPQLGSALDALRGRMEKPGVVGLAPLVRAEGPAWIYLTGTSFTVAELVRVFAERGEHGFVRAGLELCYLATEILIEASEAMAGIGHPRHGGIDPTRLLVKPDGQVTILGYGLPQPDVDAWLGDSRLPIDEDALRYLPPERFQGPGDLSSDLFSLTLVALELMLGRPVYDGLVDDLAAQAGNCDAVRRLYARRDTLPATVLEALVRALKPDRDARYRDGVEYLYAIHDLLSSIDADGPPLVEVIARFRGLSSRERMDGSAATGAFSPEQLAELTADLAQVDGGSLPAPTRPRPSEPEPEPEPEGPPEARRWATRVDRGAAKEPEATSSSVPSAADRLRDRLRQGRRREGDDPAPDDPRDRLRRRLKDAGSASAPPVTEDRPRPRRVRDRRDDEGGGAASEPPEAVEPDPIAPVVEAPPVEPIAEPPPPAPPPAASGPPSAAASAAALLERLRGGGHTAEPAPPLAAAPRPVEPGVPVAPVAEPEPEPETPAPEPPAVAPVAEETALPPTQVAEPPTLKSRPPSAVPAAEPPTVARRVRILAPDGRFVEIVPGDETPAELARRAASRLGLPTVGLTGRLERAWRLDPPRVDLAEAQLVAVENVPIVRDLRVANPEAGADHRFRAHVGAALTAAEVIGHLRDWLGLPDAPWALFAGGAAVHPDTLIGDVPGGALDVDLDPGAAD